MQPGIIDIAAEVSARLKILSHPKRLVLLCFMAEGEQPVGRLAELTGMREAAVSQQLMLLRKDGVVNVRREGQMAFYSLADENTRAVLEFLHRRFCPPENGKGKKKWLGF